MPVLPITLLVALVFVLVIVGMFNSLVALRNNCKNAYAQIDVQLKRRHDLIPNIVETCKGYMSHERQTLEAVIAARNNAITASQQAAANPADGTAIIKVASAENALSGNLGRLLALNEAYPDLKANQNMLQLQEELTSTENKIAFARQAFNDAVMNYNIACQSFPSNMIGAIFGFRQTAMWQLENPDDRERVPVKF